MIPQYGSKDFIQAIEQKETEIRDLQSEIDILKDLVNVQKAEAIAMKHHCEFMMKAIAETAWINGRYTHSKTFEDFWGNRTLIVGDV